LKPQLQQLALNLIMSVHNQERSHSTLGYLSPAEFQRAARMEQAAA